MTDHPDPTTPMKRKPPRYLIFDGRYHSDPDRALVMDTEDTIEEAQRMRPSYGSDAVIVDGETGEIVPNRGAK